MTDSKKQKSVTHSETSVGSMDAFDRTNSDSQKQNHLVSRLIQGQPAAVDQLINEHQSWMLQLADHILLDQQLAEDCVQESFIAALRNISTQRDGSSFRSWLKRIVINNCLMKLRQQKRRREVDIDELMPKFDKNDCRIESNYSALRTPESVLQEQQSVENIQLNINSLPNEYRVVFLLRDVEGLSTKEVAELLSCSEGAIRVRLHRARCALKKLLEPFICEGSLV